MNDDIGIDDTMTNGWGWPDRTMQTGIGVASPSAGSDDRATRRAAERDRRSAERHEAALARTERRAVQRDAASEEREREREARRVEEDQRRTAAADGDRGGAAPTDDLVISKRRRSGALSRTGEEVRTERDTRSYTTIVDIDRIRTLSKRGASLSGLAGAFGISIEEVEEALRTSDS